MSRMHRRQFLNLTALAAGGAFVTSRVVFAHPAQSDPRLVVVILRGALDGLAAVAPYGDRDYAGLRRDFALRQPGEKGGALPLDGFFGLHPALAFLGQSYAARELTVLHAVASPYRERSHFDGQDVLESGAPGPHASQSGWLNRALAAAPVRRQREAGIALAQNVPLVMRGPAPVASWSPSRLTALDDDTLARLADLYAGDSLLSTRLADALAADAVAAESGRSEAAMAAPRAAPPANRARYGEVVHAAAGFLRQEDGPRVAVFDTTGWDTHANEGGAEGQLAGRLAALDGGLAMLKQDLGPVWGQTAVLLITEFGRTAAINGTRGTDHGTATVAFLVGGAVAGGRVICDWPGLSARALYQGRDLAPTVDLRSVLKGLLEEHVGVPAAALEKSVFPDSRHARPLRGLLRA
jgi:uncharacterized protein (DUF1501 family)